MPPKKSMTPHQYSQGLSYVHKEPAFLARLKGQTVENERAKRKFADYEDGQDDDDVDELEGAQVVELDKQGREVHKDVGEPEDEAENADDAENKDDDSAPAVDENGRLLFRAKKKKTGKQSVEDAIAAHKKESGKDKDSKNHDDKPKKKKKKTKAPVALSFDPDDE
ncbi:hypothetical protein BC940DRAFT_302576 [Gongronella butleri]|nr:hypothetical protein BC940DRAFT_302576 [Gongronella butleri]